MMVLGLQFLSGSAGVPAVGERAPDFVLTSQDGSVVSLKDFRGSWVVLYFYPKDNTPACTLEARAFERDLTRYRQMNAAVIGISRDSAESHHTFCVKQGLTFKLLSDRGEGVAEQYGSLRSIAGFKLVARNTFLIDPTGKIADVWTSVHVGHHSEKVLASLAVKKGLQD